MQSSGEVLVEDDEGKNSIPGNVALKTSMLVCGRRPTNSLEVNLWFE